MIASVTSLNVYEDTIVNQLKSSVYKNLGTITVPWTFDNPAKSDLVYNYEITPAMPYGMLEQFK